MSLISNLLRSAAAPTATQMPAGSAEIAEPRRLYLDMVQRTIINTVYEDPAQTFGDTYRPEVREIGSDWPSVAHSMIGNRRMGNLRMACDDAIAERIPGDFGFDPLGLARDPDQFARRQVLPVCLALSVTCETPVILLVVVVTRRS